MLDLLIQPAIAQEVVNTASKQQSIIASLAPLLIIFTIFYFLVLRPQNRKMQEQQKMIDAITKGNEIMTNGGIYGKVTKTDHESGILEVNIAENVNIRINKSAVAEVVNN